MFYMKEIFLIINQTFWIKAIVKRFIEIQSRYIFHNIYSIHYWWVIIKRNELKAIVYIPKTYVVLIRHSILGTKRRKTIMDLYIFLYVHLYDIFVNESFLLPWKYKYYLSQSLCPTTESDVSIMRSSIISYIVIQYDIL